jgi:ubiquinone/menaquinone biosynthesis C-methylase UbiE
MGDVKRIYDESYFANPAFRETDHRSYFGYMDYLSDRENIQRRLRQVMAHVEQTTPVGRCLDIGCGPGLFVQVAEERGWESWGVELNENAVEWANEHISDRVRCGTTESIAWPDEYFDCVTIFDVIEHLADPRADLREVWRVLRPGGMLVIVTPDAGAWVTNALGAHWLEMKRVPEHLQFFSVTGLSRLLAACGFDSIEWHSMGKITTVRMVLADLQFYSKSVFGNMEKFLDRLHLADTILDVDPRSKLCLYARKTAAPLPIDVAPPRQLNQVPRVANTGMGKIGARLFRPTESSEAPITKVERMELAKPVAKEPVQRFSVRQRREDHHGQ